MQILVYSGSFVVTDEMEARARREAEGVMGRYGERVTRVETYIDDVNGPKAGVDKRCTMEARLAGQPPIAVEHRAEDVGEAIAGAARKLGRAVANRLGRLDDTHKSAL